MKNKKIVFWGFLIISMCIMAGLGIKAKEINKIMQDLDDQIVNSRQELERDQERLEDLKEEKENMNSPEYIEKVAREKLGMVKKDDIVFKQK